MSHTERLENIRIVRNEVDLVKLKLSCISTDCGSMTNEEVIELEDCKRRLSALVGFIDSNLK